MADFMDERAYDLAQSWREVCVGRAPLIGGEGILISSWGDAIVAAVACAQTGDAARFSDDPPEQVLACLAEDGFGNLEFLDAARATKLSAEEGKLWPRTAAPEAIAAAFALKESPEILQTHVIGDPKPTRATQAATRATQIAPRTTQAAARATQAGRKTQGGRYRGTQIEKEDFLYWKQSCQVRQVEAGYDMLVYDARENNRTIQDELEARGFRDHVDFNRAQPRFPLTCSPSDMAEMGCGYPMYFHFVRFVAALLLFVYVAQIPAMVHYGRGHYLERWGWLSGEVTWFDLVFGDKTMFTNPSQACNCTGNNRGVASGNFGETCAAWDLDRCRMVREPSDAFSGRRGKWCCRKWCFASPSCQVAVNTFSPSLSNVRYRGMVRSTSACVQDDSILQYCSNYEDDRFDEAWLPRQSDEAFIGEHMLTPGNWGPHGLRKKEILSANLLCLVVLLVSLICMSRRQIVTVKMIDACATEPNDFAVLAKGFPADATDEAAISEFFRMHVLRAKDIGDNKVEIVKVVIAFSAAEFRLKMKDMKRLQAELKKNDGEKTSDEIKAEIKQIEEEIQQEFDEGKGFFKSAGAAVIIFRYQKHLFAAVDRWRNFWAKYFNWDSINFLGLRIPVGKLPLYDGKFALQIERAPNPGDINWEDIGALDETRWRKFFLLWGMLILLLCISFGITYALNLVQQKLTKAGLEKSENKHERYAYQTLSLLPGVGVSLINIALKQASYFAASREVHETVTGQDFSQSLKQTICVIVNTTGIILFVNDKPIEWYITGGLVDDVFYMLLADSLVSRFVSFFDFAWWLNAKKRYEVDAQIEQWNETIQMCVPPKTDEDTEKLKDLKREVEVYKTAFEPSEMPIADCYARTLNTFFCGLFFSPIWPPAALMGSLGLALQYMVDKILLLRWQKRPSKPQNQIQARRSLSALWYVMPIKFCVSTWFILTPSWTWKDMDQLHGHFMFCFLICLVFMLLPQTFWRTICCCPLCIWDTSKSVGKDKHDDAEDYYVAQYLWPTDFKYHRDQFVYKMLPTAKNPDIIPLEEVRLPGDVRVGDVVFSTIDFTRAVGEVLTKGDRGVVRGLATGGTDKEQRVNIDFENLKDANLFPWQFSKDGLPSRTDGDDEAALEKEASKPLVQAPPPVLSQSSGLAVYRAKMQSVEPAPVVYGAKPVRPLPEVSEDITWQYETGKGFEDYEKKNQAKIESTYQHFKNGRGNKRMEITNNQVELSLDFRLMTQRLNGLGGKTRKIRRIDKE